MFIAIQKFVLIGVLGFICGSVTLAPSMAVAQSNVSKPRTQAQRPRDPGQDAIITVDGAAVYSAPNFDAPVKEYLDRGKRYKISRKVYPGIGGLGAFYKIRLSRGNFGYVTDVDVEISGRQGRQAWRDEQAKGGAGDPLQIQEELEDESVPELSGDTLYLQSKRGLSVLSVNYSETIANRKRSANTPMIGFRQSGPTSYLGGMPLDLELALINKTPAFYDDIASRSSGFLFLGSALAMFPLVDQPTKYLYYAFGPSLKYSMFDVTLKNTPALGGVDSQELSLGAQVALGIAVRVGRHWSLRLDARYNYENEGYPMYSVAIQR